MGKCEKCGGQHRTDKHGLPRRAGAGIPLIEACELGYECPKGHYDPSGNPVFSEFESHLFCFECQDDYPTEECPIQRPSWQKQDEFDRFVTGLPFKAIVKPGSRSEDTGQRTAAPSGETQPGLSAEAATGTEPVSPTLQAVGWLSVPECLSKPDPSNGDSRLVENDGTSNEGGMGRPYAGAEPSIVGLVHASLSPFQAVCGADEPNQRTADWKTCWASVTCKACLAVVLNTGTLTPDDEYIAHLRRIEDALDEFMAEMEAAFGRARKRIRKP